MADRIGTGTPTRGRLVDFHAKTGVHTALVTQVNPDDTLSLTVFQPSSIFYRDNVRQMDEAVRVQYDTLVGNDEEAAEELAQTEMVGYWEWPVRV